MLPGIVLRSNIYLKQECIMKAYFVQTNAWLMEDPRRAKIVAALIAAGMLIAALASPDAAFAGPIGGGSDVGGI
jgi:hypothetical protein